MGGFREIGLAFQDPIFMQALQQHNPSAYQDLNNLFKNGGSPQQFDTQLSSPVTPPPPATGGSAVTSSLLPAAQNAIGANPIANAAGTPSIPSAGVPAGGSGGTQAAASIPSIPTVSYDNSSKTL